MTACPSPSVSVVILSHNRRENLRGLLESLCPSADALGLEIVVVDNASGDGSGALLDLLQSRFPALIVFRSAENLGVAAGRNCGYRLARADYILSLDDDALVAPRDIIRLRDALAANGALGVLSPRVLEPGSGQFANDHGASPCEVGSFHGACYMLPRAILERVGYLDPLCRFGGEELELSIRLRVAGYRVGYEPAVVAIHSPLAHTGLSRQRRMRSWIYNFVRIHFKFFPLPYAVMLASRFSFTFAVAGLARQAPALILQIPAVLVRAIADGMRQRTPIPLQVARYYYDPRTRPDLGNVTLASKIGRRFAGKVAARG